MCDAVLYGPIQSRTISTGLTTRDDSQRLQVHGFYFNSAAGSWGLSAPGICQKLKKQEAVRNHIEATQLTAIHLSMAGDYRFKVADEKLCSNAQPGTRYDFNG
jgi:hypothetical protein